MPTTLEAFRNRFPYDYQTTKDQRADQGYVASPLASATTGAALRVDGGVIKSAF